MPTANAPTEPDRRAAAQHESWTRGRRTRRRGVTLGNVRSHLREYPDDLTDVVITAVEAATEDGQQ